MKLYWRRYVAPLAVFSWLTPLYGEEVSFRNDVMAVLSRAGCNQGTCHGNFNGKNGFRLSLRGENPLFDLNSLTRDTLGRRLNLHEPERSLVLLKATGQVAHEGGVRFKVGSTEYGILRNWIAAGARPDPSGTLTLQRLEVEPRERVLRDGVDRQQLTVRAQFDGGTWRDVTNLAVFEPGNELVHVTPGGEVVAHKSGEATVVVRYLDRRVPVRLAFVPPRPGFHWKDPPEHNFIDKLVDVRLKDLQVEPAELCNDAVFLRRAFLDVCGVLPTAEEARRFLADTDADKRTRLIDDLLSRPEYAAFWAMKWADLLRSEEKAVDAKGVRLFQRWLRHCFEEDVPLDQFARRLLTSQGSTYENPAANFYRTNLDPTKAAESAALVFMGVRIGCARCHNHPFDRWTQSDYYGLSAFFARVKTRMVDNGRKDKLDTHELVGDMIVYLDREGEVADPSNGGGAMAPRVPGASVLPGGLTPPGSPVDRREVLADWLTGRDNPYFARSLANRTWYHLLGRGLVEPVEDVRESNPASNEPLLDALAGELVRGGYSQRHLIRVIMASRTYQASYRSSPTNEEDQNFSRTVPRQLSAEVLLDAISQMTEVPGDFTGHPRGTRAVELPGVLGAPAFLRAFGRPDRLLSCECERSGDSTLQQALVMINGEEIVRKIEKSPRVGRLLGQKGDAIAEELYLAGLSRQPTEAEARLVEQHLAGQADRRRAVEDLLWAVINSKEFLLRR